MGSPPRFNLLGTGVSALSLAEACDLVLTARDQRGLGYVCCATAYNVNLARTLPALRAAYHRAWLTTPDGMPLVWLGRWHGHRSITRVYGPDLLAAVCDAGRARGLRHFFYGGDEGVAAQLQEKLCARYPGLQVVGTCTPPFRDPTADELAALRAQAAATRPDVIWVGLSSPKQELFMAAHGSTLDAGLLIGVGAAFDFLSGRVPQAPRWMQRAGLEWLHRLATEPRRLWRRYLVHNPLFVLRTLAQLTGLRKYPLEIAETPKS
ncbi:Putative N-acetylmannosaminyltransferase [Lacunisphaera limnophila]|uniref:N-acetylmannosaminyltransferase n=1 Tax=Lacunisphaera limnophila TaxID=1838286 RepID=A0A1D8AUP0_9BACT|nr:WecB/TagA/CpsF family glycosyltransferase [Lacunisphaera limnophila]AOS44607.1 Putative N-acetylmannosaminyltransferase [Lacunisphaera limnophila]